jgi:hypothetical protein
MLFMFIEILITNVRRYCRELAGPRFARARPKADQNVFTSTLGGHVVVDPNKERNDPHGVPAAELRPLS